MKTFFRNHVAALCLMAPAALVLVALPSAVLAQAAAPELRSLEVLTDGDLEPGSRLRIKVVGTPRGLAIVRIRGVRESIALREVGPGVYIGRYTIKRSDRIEDDAEVRATLRAAGRTAAASYSVAEVMAGASVATPAPIVVAPAPPLRIDRFAMAPLDRIEPGAELRFALDGAPGAAVLVDIPGMATDVALREIRPGHYEGGYTVRRSDNLILSRPIVATLRAGDRAVSASLAGLSPPQSPADNRPPNVVNIAPRDGEVVAGGPNIEISGNFEDHGGSGVDPASVSISLSGRNITREAQINANSFNYSASLAPGHHAVNVTARDRAGNTVRKDWSFDVAAVAPINVPLQVLNHSNNGTVEGRSTVIQGRTAPFASVVVKVDATPPLGGVINVREEVYSETLQADASGNFSFSFNPRFAVPGTRYDIVMVSTKANVRSEARLVLFQRQG